MADGSATLDVLISAFSARLQSELPTICNNGNTFICLDAWAVPANSPGRWMFAIAPLSGTFDEDNMVGGGQNDVRTDAAIELVIHSPLVLDQAKRELSFLTDSSLGVVQIVTQVLAVRLPTGRRSITPASQLVADSVKPASFEFARRERKIGAVGLTWRLRFDWDLS